MGLAQMGRHDQVGEHAADDIGAGIAEGRLRGGVEVGDASGGVHGDDAVERGVHDRAAGLALELPRHVLEAQDDVDAAAVAIRKRVERQPRPDAAVVRLAWRPDRDGPVPARRDLDRLSREGATHELIEIARRGAIAEEIALDRRTDPEEVPEAPIHQQGSAVRGPDLQGHGRILQDPFEQAQGVGIRADIRRPFHERSCSWCSGPGLRIDPAEPRRSPGDCTKENLVCRLELRRPRRRSRPCGARARRRPPPQSVALGSAQQRKPVE